MRKFAAAISFLILWSAGVCLADQEINKIGITIPKANVSFSCSKSNPEEDIVFFGIYADDGKHLYDFFGSSPLPMSACRNMVNESQKILNKADHITLSGHDRMAGYQIRQEEWGNELVRQYRGKIHEASFFLQISNGETCKCWFEDCTCLAVPIDESIPR